MSILLKQSLPAEPERIWPLITEPKHMNRWLKARVRLLAAGDGSGAGSVGAVRRVSIRMLGLTLHFNQIIELVEPPRRLVYHVIAGQPVRRHRGEITLRQIALGTELAWHIDFSLLVPGQRLAARALLQPILKQSLAALAELARDTSERAASRTPGPTSLDEVHALPELFAAAEGVLAEQHELAARLSAAGDPKRWYAEVYPFVTESQIEACRAGLRTNPAWVLRTIVRFHRYYVENLRRWLGDVDGQVESHWRAAFRTMERETTRLGQLSGAMARGLAEAVRAHVDGDLPRALAEVYVEHYAGRCSYSRFRADYTLMSDIFPGARSKLIRRLPLPIQLVCLGVPVEVRELLAAWVYYDIPRHRRRAFERGEQLAALTLLLGPYRAQQHLSHILPALANGPLVEEPLSPRSTGHES